MKIHASSLLTPIKSLKKTAKIAALTLPLMAMTESCSPWFYHHPPCPPHHHPHHYPHHHPHWHPYPYFGWFGSTEAQDTVQGNDVFELSKNDIAYTDNIKKTNEPENTNNKTTL